METKGWTLSLKYFSNTNELIESPASCAIFQRVCLSENICENVLLFPAGKNVLKIKNNLSGSIFCFLVKVNKRDSRLTFTAWKVSICRVFLILTFPIWTEYGGIWSIFPYSVRMWENTDQKNSEYGHFSRRDYWCRIFNFAETKPRGI